MPSSSARRRREIFTAILAVAEFLPVLRDDTLLEVLHDDTPHMLTELIALTLWPHLALYLHQEGYAHASCR